MENLDNQIIVSIQCLAYNHAPYIRQCLDGFVMQKTNFRFEAIVHDDASTDGTQDIIREYEKKYPDIIKPIYQKENQYSKGIPGYITNLITQQCKGKYIAVCEGDDYWIDPLKLQKQVDFLEAHPDYTLFFHNALIRYQDRNLPDRLLSTFETGDFDTTKLFEKWQLPLASVLLRKSVLESDEYKDLSKSVHGGFLLFLASTKSGKVYGLSQCLSVYRKNAGGVSNTMSPAYCLQVECEYAIASEDSGAINVMRKKAINKLTYQIPKIIKKDKKASELAKVANDFDKYILIKAFIRYFFKVLPLKLYDKVKRE